MASINVLSMNVTSLIGRERRLEVDQQIKDEKTDIVLIQESHLTERHKLRLSNMTV